MKIVCSLPVLYIKDAPSRGESLVMDVELV
jgi:hypothetical protein